MNVLDNGCLAEVAMRIIYRKHLRSRWGRAPFYPRFVLALGKLRVHFGQSAWE